MTFAILLDKSIKFQISYNTEIYASEGGYVAFKQYADPDYSEHLVLLTPEQAQVLLKQLPSLIRFAKEWRAIHAQKKLQQEQE